MTSLQLFPFIINSFPGFLFHIRQFCNHFTYLTGLQFFLCYFTVSRMFFLNIWQISNLFLISDTEFLPLTPKVGYFPFLQLDLSTDFVGSALGLIWLLVKPRRYFCFMYCPVLTKYPLYNIKHKNILHLGQYNRKSA